jgi:FkbM family methyltransferase
MSIKHEMRKFLWRAGYDFCRLKETANPIARKKQIFYSRKIDTVLDIGANTGQSGWLLRKVIGYSNRIISFEPLSSAFELLKANAKSDPHWKVCNCALGDTEEKREINIAGNSGSSSLLKMLPSHVRSAPESKYIGKEMVEVKRLDSIFGNWCRPTNRVYMKIDTQGFESKVLQGAENSLKQIDTVQMEMSLVPLYEGESLFNELCMLMSEKGFILVAIETVFSDPDTGQILQVDGIFHRL